MNGRTRRARTPQAIAGQAVISSGELDRIRALTRPGALANATKRPERKSNKLLPQNEVAPEMLRKRTVKSESNAKAMKELQMQHDKVKAMKSIMARAKVLHERQAQLKVKEQKIEQQKINDQIWHERAMYDLSLAVDEEQLQHMKKREHDRRVAEEQRQQRLEIERNKIIEQERKEQEGQQMLRKIALDKEREEQNKKAQAKLVLSHQQQLIVENKKRIDAKKRQEQKELEADLRVMEYVRKKDAETEMKERRRLADNKRRNEQHARLLKQQERATDKQAEDDAIRARIAQDLYEEKQIEREEQKAREAERRRQRFVRGLDEQTKLKPLKIAEERRRDREYIERAQREAAVAEMTEYENQQRRVAAGLKHAEQIKLQIEADKRAREEKRREDLLLLERQRAEQAAEQESLVGLKQEFLREMKHNGIDPKFIKDLNQYQI